MDLPGRKGNLYKETSPPSPPPPPPAQPPLNPMSIACTNAIAAGGGTIEFCTQSNDTATGYIPPRRFQFDPTIESALASSNTDYGKIFLKKFEEQNMWVILVIILVVYFLFSRD